MAFLKRRASQNAIVLTLTAITVLGAATLQAQQTSGPNGTGSAASGGGSTSALGSVAQAQQQLATPGPAVSPSSSATQGGIDPSFRGSIVSGKATDEVLPLSLDEAMQRGLRTNLGLILQAPTSARPTASDSSSCSSCCRRRPVASRTRFSRSTWRRTV
jgi:hypothetical protein